MDLVMLGTGTPLPDPARAGAAHLVSAGEHHLLVDCGRGCCMRLAAAGVGATQLAAVLLTHLHSDHVTDLGDVITTRWISSLAPAPLDVVGPPGTRSLVEATLAMLAPDIGWRLAHHDDLGWEPAVNVVEVSDGLAFEVGDLAVSVAPTEHAPVHPTVGYRVESGGASVVLAGDTVPCAGLDRLCTGAGVYVQSVVRADLVRAIGVPRLLDVLDYHSTVEDAARTAARAGARTLVLTHCVPGVGPGQAQDWIALATEEFDGEVLLPDDLARITC